MVVQYHNSDWKQLDDEESARAALKGTQPGQYTIPYAADGKARQDPEWQKKFSEGPAAMLVVLPGTLAMGKQLTQWFVMCLVLSAMIAYIAASTLAPGTDYMKVFQVTGSVGILAYAGAVSIGSIWFGYSWGKSFKDIIDGIVYGLLTAGVFGWLWPAA